MTSVAADMCPYLDMQVVEHDWYDLLRRQRLDETAEVAEVTRLLLPTGSVGPLRVIGHERFLHEDGFAHALLQTDDVVLQADGPAEDPLLQEQRPEEHEGDLDGNNHPEKYPDPRARFHVFAVGISSDHVPRATLRREDGASVLVRGECRVAHVVVGASPEVVVVGRRFRFRPEVRHQQRSHDGDLRRFRLLTEAPVGGVDELHADAFDAEAEEAQAERLEVEAERQQRVAVAGEGALPVARRVMPGHVGQRVAAVLGEGERV